MFIVMRMDEIRMRTSTPKLLLSVFLRLYSIHDEYWGFIHKRLLEYMYDNGQKSFRWKLGCLSLICARFVCYKRKTLISFWFFRIGFFNYFNRFEALWKLKFSWSISFAKQPTFFWPLDHLDNAGPVWWTP